VSPGAPRPPTGGVYLQLWPDWWAWRLPEVARFSAIIKVGAGASLDVPATIAVRLLDRGGDLIAEEALAVPGEVRGPAWQRVESGFVRLDAAVTDAEGELAGVVSERVRRAEVEVPVILRAVGGELGVDGEPRLWWCYRNLTGGPVSAIELLRSRTLGVDGVAVAVPTNAYNGPSELLPWRAMTGWWSLDDLGIDRRTRHTFWLEILSRRSAEVARDPG
jgi:hypothetical protein